MKNAMILVLVCAVLTVFCTEEEKKEYAEGCNGLATKVYECDVLPVDFYETFTRDEFEKECESSKEEDSFVCFLACDTSENCDQFNECFYLCDDGQGTEVSG